jgi:hypothetical protein
MGGSFAGDTPGRPHIVCQCRRPVHGKLIAAPDAIRVKAKYQYYFDTERGVRGLTKYRYELGLFVWKFKLPDVEVFHPDLRPDRGRVQ